MRKARVLAGACPLVVCLASACLSRPVATTEPHTIDLYVEPIQSRVVDKLDLVFMIDNSRSMGDKQTLLAKAVPRLVSRLAVPPCTGPAGEVTRAAPDEPCPSGTEPEFRAVRDIHVAVITSSLGGHGASNPACGNDPPDDDRALLLPSVRPGLTSYQDSGFLAWDPDQKLVPPGESDARRLGQQFGDMVKAAGEQGCGYESSLEAWYRFLVDPEPPQSIVVHDDQSTAEGVDQQVLQQRAAFLRPDSLVAIVMLSDENDCSIRDDGYGFLLAHQPADGNPNDAMLRASSVCDKDPNDPCCAPCAAGTLPGCPPVERDPACQLGDRLEPQADSTNLRCFENKRRFGYDFLYPLSRYVDALTQPEVPRRSDGALVENPLFARAPGLPRRSLGMVYLAAIVGVPWQDIADDDSLTGPGLRYLSAEELTRRDRWRVIAGDPSQNLEPSDPFMHESVAPRSGNNPITGESIQPASSLDPTANAINGHERPNVDGGDLQYACTFALAEPADCSDDGCDCSAPSDPLEPGVVAGNSPLCQPPSGGPAQTRQYFGKAYPGLRQLQLLSQIGDAAIVASICPKVQDDAASAYGYNPAIDAIVDRLKTQLTGRCLPRPLATGVGLDGKLPCVVVEAQEPGPACGCGAAGRSPASAEAAQLVKQQLAERGECDTATTPACASFCLCELAQAEGDALDQCLNSEVGSDVPGYCYVDPYGEHPQGNPALVAGCDRGRPLLRFVGRDTPAPGATAFIACLGATVH